MRSVLVKISVLSVLSSVAGSASSCGGDDAPPGGSGSGASCPAFTACGGDPVGNWTVSDVCAANLEQVFGAVVSQPACSNALMRTRDIEATGSYMIGADKQASSALTLSGTGEFLFNDACVQALGLGDSAAGQCAAIQGQFMSTAGASASCTVAGADCGCTISLQTPLNGSGSYSVANDKLVVDALEQPFCVEGNKLTIQTSAFGLTATFTFTK